MKKLSEVVKIVGMSRRVIQEYEKEGLSQTPNTTNKYGHLLYDDKTIERLCRIRFYRDLGYSKSRIKSILSDNNSRSAVISQIGELEKKKEKLEASIAVAKASEKMGLSPQSILSGLPFTSAMTYDMLLSLLGSICVISEKNEITDCFTKVLSEEDHEEICEAAARIYESFDRGIPSENESVLQNVDRIHDIASKALSDSILFFSLCSLYISPDTELAGEFDEQLGKGFSEYLYCAVRHYCNLYADNLTDKKIYEAMESLEYYCRKKSAADSEKVQNEVKKLYGFYDDIACIAPEVRLELLYSLGKAFESRAVTEQLENNERDIAKFISEAISIFCNSMKNK
ncbi:MAG: MerR family transcriptional regulator [Oscillospiraceae bacterium]|nr:MerR family transcriptional regulator [Oscillospiraceae bacterium]